VPEGQQIEEPVYLEYILDDKDSTVVDYNRIIAKANSSITVVMVYRSFQECPVLHAGLTYLSAEKNAVINLIQIQLLSEKAVHLNNIGARLHKDGKINIIHAELGSRKAINGIHAMLSGDSSGLDINTVFFGDKNRSIDFNYVADHTGKKTGSEINLNGALMDTSHKTFRGTIDFKKGASGAKGHESEYTLLFGAGIKNVSAPLILCGEDDVEGKHAANSGKIDESKLFYMMSRGLDELSAKKLIIEAWFEPVISKIPFNSLREDISEYLKERLSHV
jgi:FeS assembly protein SufD